MTILAQPFCETSASLANSVCLYSLINGVRHTHEQHKLPASRYRRVEEIALQHDIVLGVHDYYHGRILAALRFVYCGRVGQNQLVKEFWTESNPINTYPMNYAEMTGLPCRVVAEV